MTDRVIIHSFHKLLFTTMSSESHLGGAGVIGDGQLIGEGGLLWPAGGQGVWRRDPSLLCSFILNLKGPVQKNNNPFCRQPASFYSPTEQNVQVQNLVQSDANGGPCSGRC